jgi:hypothetical protein
MKIEDIYFYEGENGGAIQSPVKIAGANYTPMYRLIADDGKAITDGTQVLSVIDIQTNDKDKWTDCDVPVDS